MEDRRNVGESSRNFGDGTDQRVESLMFMMMMILATIGHVFAIYPPPPTTMWVYSKGRTMSNALLLLLKALSPILQPFVGFVFGTFYVFKIHCDI